MKLVCEHPTFGWKIGTHRNKEGEVVDTVTFSFNEAYKHYLPSDIENHAMSFPCGKCVACMKKKRMEQAVRITHEIESHDENCFITLTYNNENLPLIDKNQVVYRNAPDATQLFPTLVIDDYQKFMKRLRSHLGYHGCKKKLRYFVVGEYGSLGKRPHYHLIVFGWKPTDLVEHKFHGKYWTYRSKTIEDLWPYGFVEVGVDVNAGVAKYCAQYVTKKFNKQDQPNKYVMPEFVKSSKMAGGLGVKFVDRFHRQLAEQGYVLVLNRHTGQGFKQAIPKYYVSRLKNKFPEDFKILKDRRLSHVEETKMENESRSQEYWLEFWKNYDQAKYAWREKMRREVRSYEQSVG